MKHLLIWIEVAHLANEKHDTFGCIYDQCVDCLKSQGDI